MVIMKKCRMYLVILIFCSLLHAIAVGETKYVSLQEESQQTVTTWVRSLDNYIKPINIRIESEHGTFYYSLDFQNVSNVQIEYVKYQFKIYDISGSRLCYMNGSETNSRYHVKEYNASTGILMDNIAPNTVYELTDYSNERSISSFKTQSGNRTKIDRFAIAISEILTSDGHIYCVPEESWTWYDSKGSIERGNPAADLPVSVTNEMKNAFIDLNTGITAGSQMYNYVAEIYGYPEGGCYVDVDRKCIVNDMFGLESGDVVVQIGSYRINNYEDLISAFLGYSQENSFTIVYYDNNTQTKQECTGRLMDDDALIQKLAQNKGESFDHTMLEGLEGYKAAGDQWEYSAYMDDQKNHVFIKTTIGSDMLIPEFYIECNDLDIKFLDGVDILVRNQEFSFSDLIPKDKGVYMLAGNRLRDAFLQIADADECSFRISGMRTVEVDVYSERQEATECLASINQWAKVLEAIGYWDQLDEDSLSRNEMRFLTDAEQIEILKGLDIVSFDPKLLDGLDEAYISEDGYSYDKFISIDLLNLSVTVLHNSQTGVEEARLACWLNNTEEDEYHMNNRAIKTIVVGVDEETFIYYNPTIEGSIALYGFGTAMLNCFETIMNSDSNIDIEVYGEGGGGFRISMEKRLFEDLIEWYNVLKVTKYWEQWSEEKLMAADEQHKLLSDAYIDKLSSAQEFTSDLLCGVDGYADYGNGMWDYCAQITYTYDNGESMIFMPRIGDDLCKPHVFFGVVDGEDNFSFDAVKVTVDGKEYIFSNLEEASGYKYMVCGNRAKEMLKDFESANEIDICYYRLDNENIFCNISSSRPCARYEDVLKWVKTIDAAGIWDSVSPEEMDNNDELYCIGYPEQNEKDGSTQTTISDKRITTVNTNSDVEDELGTQIQDENYSSMFTYVINEKDSITITGYSGVESEVIIPEEIEGRKVEIIGECAFKGSKTIKKITLPSSILEIQTYAFKNCDSLQDVIMSDGVSLIGAWVFKNCPQLDMVVLPASVTVIQGWAFEGCSDSLHFVVAEGSYSEQYAIDEEIPYSYC